MTMIYVYYKDNYWITKYHHNATRQEITDTIHVNILYNYDDDFEYPLWLSNDVYDLLYEPIVHNGDKPLFVSLCYISPVFYICFVELLRLSCQIITNYSICVEITATKARLKYSRNFCSIFVWKKKEKEDRNEIDSIGTHII